MSENLYQSLSPADRKIIDEAGSRRRAFSATLQEGDQKFLALLKEKAKVNADVEVAAFQRQVESYVRNSSSS